MPSAHLKITGGPGPQDLELELDGRPLGGVVAFQVSADIREGRQTTCQAVVVFHARLEIDTEVEVLLVRGGDEAEKGVVTCP